MKKLVVLGMGLCVALAFSSCKSSESAYKKAYEKAKQQELAEAPASVFGHTGFTGTCVWVDPDNELVFVFLSNRTYPVAFGHDNLMKLDIRSRIQQAMYQSIMY